MCRHRERRGEGQGRAPVLRPLLVHRPVLPPAPAHPSPALLLRVPPLAPFCCDAGSPKPRHEHPCQQLCTLSENCWTSRRYRGDSLRDGSPRKHNTARRRPTPGSSTPRSGHGQPRAASTHAQQRSEELLYLRAWLLEERGQRGPEGRGRDSDTNTAPTRQTAFGAGAAATAGYGTRRGCAVPLPQHFLFAVQPGQRCKYRSAAPRVPGKPASKKQPSCSSSRCVQIQRKQNLQHILMGLNARSKSHR